MILKQTKTCVKEPHRYIIILITFLIFLRWKENLYNFIRRRQFPQL